MKTAVLLLAFVAVFHTVRASSGDDRENGSEPENYERASYEETYQQGQQEKNEKQEEKKDGVDDYQIYDLIDTMRELTSHRTFYELLEVQPETPDDELSKKFRGLSRKWHPDKNASEEARRMYTLLTAVSTLLRDPKGRARYEWILNDAPPWHRSSVRLMRGVAAGTAKLSIGQVALFALALALVVQLIAQWTAYIIICYTIWSARRASDSMSVKERKRYHKRLASATEEHSLALLAYTNSSYQNLLDAGKAMPPIPSPLSLFVFAIPLGFLRRFRPVAPTAPAIVRKTQ